MRSEGQGEVRTLTYLKAILNFFSYMKVKMKSLSSV